MYFAGWRTFMKKMIWIGLVLVTLGSLVQAADTVLLTDTFTSTIDPAKWTLIKATGATSFDESTSGNQVTPTSGYMYIQNLTINGGGAYKSKLLPVDGQGKIVIARRVYCANTGSSALTMPDEIVAEDGTVLLRWGYRNAGFGGFGAGETVTAVWGEKNEVITYDPITGQGTYSFNGSAPITVAGTALPAGETNLYIRGSAYSPDSTSNWKAFQDFEVTQTDRSLLTVNSAYGSPVPSLGSNVYDTGSPVTCSVANVTIAGIEYECTGWSGSGSVPSSGTTNKAIFTLSEDSSITWKWRATLLEDDFEDGVLDSSKWTAIEATGAVSFNPTNVGSSMVESNGILKISNDVNWHSGAYQTLLPVNDSGQIVISRRTQVHYEGTDAIMSDSLVTEDGSPLLSWGYFNYVQSPWSVYGFGGLTASEILAPRVDGVWDEWFDETITYDPKTGLSTLSINGETPIFISGGNAMPSGTTNVYLRGGAYAYGAGYTKQLDTFTVSQEPPVSLLTVSSAHGDPSPAIGQALHESGWITCSVADVITNGIWYQCTGWTGTGSVPASGTTNSVDIQLNESSTITWIWQTNYWLEVSVEGNGSVDKSSGYYAKDSVQNLTATPGSGWLFLNWTGAAVGFGDVSVSMSGPKSIEAVFIDPSTTAVLLQDDFDDGVLNTSMWTKISSVTSTGFNESAVGSSLSESNGMMKITMDSSNNGGAYKTGLLPVNDQGQLSIHRRTYVDPDNGSYQLTYMTENLAGEDGTTLLSWGYYDIDYTTYGFGGYNNILATGVWGSWFDETITYDPVAGNGTYSVNGSTPLLISGVAMPAGITNVYLRGGAYGGFTGAYKYFDAFSVVQGEAADQAVLSVSSEYGAPTPVKGLTLFESDSVVTCSVPGVVSTGGFMTPVIRYQCTGWTGTGSVPASGTTNSVVVTLAEDSSINWTWEPLDAVLSVTSWAGGSPSPAVGSASYPIGTEVTCSVQSAVTVDGIRYECAGWTGTGSVPASGVTNSVVVTVGETSSIVWGWRNLDSRLTVVSPYGDPTPAVGSELYSAGEVVTCSVNDVTDADIRNTCTGWQTHYYISSWNMWLSIASGTSSQMDLALDYADMRLTWLWQTDYLLDIQVEGSGTVSKTSGFYREGTSQTLTPTPAQGWVFDGWSGDAYGIGSVSVTMNAPKRVKAVFSDPGAVTNMTVAQVEGSRTVEVSYDISGTRQMIVDMAVYQNGSNLNASAISGALGMVNAGTNNVITWNAGADWNLNVDELTFRLDVEDGWMETVPYTPLNAPALLPRTGQTNSYVEIYGEDGDLQPGAELTDPRFVDNGDETVTDTLTGLIWTKTPLYYGGSYAVDWMTALSYLQASTIAGYSDWRMPNINELQSLFDYFGKTGIKRNDGGLFTMPYSSYYWSSTKYKKNSSYIYALHPAYGTFSLLSQTYYTGSYYVGNKYGVWPVRGTCTGAVHLAKTGMDTGYYSLTDEDGDLQLGEASPEPRFTDHGDGTVTDELTGLMWMKANSGTKIWTNALNASYVTNGGYVDWRLPTANELRSLVNYGSTLSVMLPTVHPFGAAIQPNYFWTGTTYPDNTGYAYAVHFGEGTLNYYAKGSVAYTLYCRGAASYFPPRTEAPDGYLTLAETGQTQSYQERDDGDVRAGFTVPSPRFTRLGPYDPTYVRDNLTGLIWYQSLGYSSYDSPYESDWYHAVDLAQSFSGFYTDWRLPNIRELQSLFDYSQTSPALPAGHLFWNVQTNAYYWSSTTCDSDTNKAWVINMSTGNRLTMPKRMYGMGITNYVCFVRSDSSLSYPAPVRKTFAATSYYFGDDAYYAKGLGGYIPTKYIDNQNGTVSDRDTGLMWLRDTHDLSRMTWSNAVEFCNRMNYGGYADWRLPNARELESLLSYDSDGYGFHTLFNVDLSSGGYYWTSTTYAGDTNMALYVRGIEGAQYYDYKSNWKRVWPVRAGK